MSLRLCLVLALCFELVLARNFTFQLVGNAPWSGRDGAFGGNLNGVLITGGGLSNGLRLSDVWASLNGGKNWTRIDANGLNAVAYGGYTLFQPRPTVPASIVIAGGDLSQTVYQTFDGVTYATLTSAPFFKRYVPSLVSASAGAEAGTNALYFFGGCDGSTRVNYNDVYTSADGRVWTRLNNAAWSPRIGMATSVVDGNSRIVVVGGDNWFGLGLRDDAWISSVGALFWEPLFAARGVLSPARGYANIININEILYLIGGMIDPYNQHTVDDVWASENGGQSFVQITADSNIVPVKHEVVVNLGNRIVLLAGSTQTQSVSTVYQEYAPMPPFTTTTVKNKNNLSAQ